MLSGSGIECEEYMTTLPDCRVAQMCCENAAKVDKMYESLCKSGWNLIQSRDTSN